MMRVDADYGALAAPSDSLVVVSCLLPARWRSRGLERWLSEQLSRLRIAVHGAGASGRRLDVMASGSPLAVAAFHGACRSLSGSAILRPLTHADDPLRLLGQLLRPPRQAYGDRYTTLDECCGDHVAGPVGVTRLPRCEGLTDDEYTDLLGVV